MTLHLAFWGILLSLVIGVICAVITTYKVKSLTWLVKGYIELSRNTPLLIQVFFLYFGLSKIGLKLDGFTCGIIGLAFLGGSYMAEAFRGGLEAVSKGQIESALSIGLTPYQAFRYVIFPQAFAIATPAIGANCLFLMKETSVISAVAVAELMFVAKEVIGLDYKTNEALFLLVVFLFDHSITDVSVHRSFRTPYSESKIWGLSYYSKAATLNACSTVYG